MNAYPHEPGWKGTETSKAAAEYVAITLSQTMRAIEADIARHGPSSPEEIAERLSRASGQRWLLNSVRARVTQLKRLGRVVDSGERGLGESRRAKVQKVRVTTPEEYAAFMAAQDEGNE